jgi:glycosyltransferase involved in cell wall biosynthesis
MLSIIIPIYNSEKYLKECVNSILQQSYKDIELILVDDGSSDSSASLCDDFARHDARIVTIHKKNGGQSSARNAGLEIAKGDYITFVDSDDTLEENTYLYNIELLDTMPNVDIIQFPCINKYGSNHPKLKFKHKALITGSDNLYQAWLQEMIISNYVWNKIFRRYIFDHKRFREGMFYEDRHFISEILKDINSIYLSEIGLYYYYEREGQVTSKPDNEFILNSKIIADLSISQHIQKYPSLSYQYLERYYNCIYYYKKAKKNHWTINSNTTKQLMKDCPSFFSIIKSSAPIGIKLQIFKVKLFGLV